MKRAPQSKLNVPHGTKKKQKNKEKAKNKINIAYKIQFEPWSQS